MKKTLIAILATWGIATGALAAPVDINSADAKTLARELNGVGPDRAQAIVDYRVQHGPFRTVDELAKVKGVGKRIVEKNRENLLISSTR
jgi:competence protein ComEA